MDLRRFEGMKKFLTKLRDIAIAGFFFALPVYIVAAVVTKAWTWLSSLGKNVAGLFGVKSLLGVGGPTILTGLLLIASWIVCGFLVRLSFVAAISKAVDRWLSQLIPGYDTYKTMAEEKVGNKPKIIPYAAALVQRQGYWQPGYVVERDEDGNYVVFLPDTPETNKGHVLLARQEQIRLVPSVTANQVDASLKQQGKGLLSEYGFHAMKLSG
jgi:uncharacterized membrane protein